MTHMYQRMRRLTHNARNCVLSVTLHVNMRVSGSVQYRIIEPLGCHGERYQTTSEDLGFGPYQLLWHQPMFYPTPADLYASRRNIKDNPPLHLSTLQDEDHIRIDNTAEKLKQDTIIRRRNAQF